MTIIILSMVLGTLVYLCMARYRPTIACWCDGMMHCLYAGTHDLPAMVRLAGLCHAYPAIVPLRSDIHRPFDKPPAPNSGIGDAVCQMSNNDPAMVGAEPDFWSPMFRLIEAKRKKLGLGKAEIVRRCECKNVSKGLRWLEVICSGDTRHARAQEILERLPAALEIDQADFDHALAETQRQVTEQRAKEAAQREAELRARFKPHGIFVTESSVPSQIVMCGLTGGPEKMAKDRTRLEQIPGHLLSNRPLILLGTIRSFPFFGKVQGVVINYSFDLAVRLDLRGNAIELSNRAYTPGEIEILSRGKNVGSALQRGMGL